MTRNAKALGPALFAGFIAMAIAGCSGGGSGSNIPGQPGGSGGGQPSVTMNAFTVSGTDGANSQGTGTATIDGNQNSGTFLVNWNTTFHNDDGAGERLSLFLGDASGSTDTSGGHAVQIMGLNCDLGATLGSPDCPATSGTAVPCQFDEANMAFDCPDNQGTTQSGVNQFNVSQFLSNHIGLPGVYYLTLQACVVSDGQGDENCDLKSVQLNLY